MRKLVPALIIFLSIQIALAQKSSTASQPTAANVQSPEVAEASRLAQEVVSLYGAGKYDQALPIAKQVVQIRERLLGRDDDSVVSAVVNLAEIQFARAQYGEAQGLFERALHSYEQTSDVDSSRLSSLLDRLAVLYYRIGRTADTESFYRRSLSIREKAPKEEQADVGRSIRNLAEFYQFQGDYKKAEPLYQRLVEIRKGQGSAEPIAEALERYACLLYKTKRSEEAKEMENRALEVSNYRGITEELISAGVVNGRALNLFQPAYPAEARSGRVSGKVTVRVLINESGAVIRACAIEGPQVLMRASESAAYRSKFSATMVGGKPVKVNGVIIYNFVGQ